MEQAAPGGRYGIGTLGVKHDSPLQSVTIALDILEEFFSAPELGVSELARRLGIAKSTAHRACGVLTERGFLEKTADSRYRLGMRLYEFGHLVTTRSALRSRALPLLTEVRNAVGETVQLGVPAGADVLYVERVEGLHALRFTAEIHRRSPVHRSSAGKALAAFLPEVAAARIKGGLTAFTGHTIVVPRVFLEELEKVRQRGYAVSRDENEMGLSSLGVPVRAETGGRVIAAISMAGPTARVLDTHEAHHAQLLIHASERLTRALQSGQFSLPAASRR